MSTSQPAGHLIVECLIAQGMEIAFGVPGESFLAVLDGFHAYGNRARFVVNRQEGGAAFMAEAHGKLTGRPGVCFVTRGPGATNASIGVHNAFQDSTPMVLFVGDVGSDFRDREAFQEVDYGSFFGPSTKGFAKRVERIDDADRIPEYVARAFATAMNGRPGPVVLVLPEDMLRSETSARPLARVEAVQPWSDPGALRTLRELLLKSERPLVIAGGGGWTTQAAQALQRFAENWRLPVANAFRYQDTFDNHHPLYAGDVGIAINPKLAQRVKDADLILAIGPRLGEMTTGGYTLLEAPKAKQVLVHIHASAEELNRVYQADLAINAGMSAAARSLEVLSAPPTLPWEEWTEQAHADYEANLVPQALAGMPAEAARPGRHGRGRRAAAKAPAAGCGHHQRRRQFRELGTSLLPLSRARQGPQDAAGADQWRDGIRRAGRHRREPGDGARGLHDRGRWRFPDDGARAGDGRAAWRQEHRRAAQQRHVRHDPHAPGA
jgi:acetolactate synthase-1/2/3 large subunit